MGLHDFRKNARGELGTPTATLHREGLKKLRAGWVYKHENAIGNPANGPAPGSTGCG